MRRSFTFGGVVAGLVLIAAVFPASAQLATVTSAQAYNFDQPHRGFLRIIGNFASTEPLDLSSPDITAQFSSVLDEDDHGELAEHPGLLTARTRSQRVTVLETAPGATPFYRLTVRTCIPTQETCPNSRGLDVGEYEFRLEGVNATIAAPTQCGDPPGPGATGIVTFFAISDGINPPLNVFADEVWTCLFQKNRVFILRIP